MSALQRYAGTVLLALAAAWAASDVRAATGVDELRVGEGQHPVTVFYPTAAAATPLERGPFRFEQLAWKAAPTRGNRRLVVFSHGSGGSPWVHADLAQRFVAAGFVVAIPEHEGDNFKGFRDAGPVSWKRRPQEVSRAIDALAADPRFAPLLALDRVGMWGMSAGGHTALALAGGKRSPSALAAHCEAHLDDDFHTCVGLALQLRGDALDGVKKALARTVIRFKLDDPAWYGHQDARIAAIAAEVPFAADFDMATLAKPPVPLGIVQAGRDAWLPPRHHSNRVLAACKGCETIADLPTAGHGSLLSPPPPKLSETAETLLRDPPGFDRGLVPDAHARIVHFFVRHLPQ